MSVLDKVRRWIDGESAELVLEEAARDAQVKPRSQSEEFIVKIARAVESVMQDEMVPLPQGEVLIPTEYIIFLSEPDDKNWQGAKRRGLEQGLFHILSERAREIAGKKKLKTKSFALELRVDGTLDEGEVIVTHSWTENEQDHTNVEARSKPTPTEAPKTSLKQAPNLPTAFPTQPVPPPIPPPNFLGNSPPQQPRARVESEGEDMTHVVTRKQILYNLEIWRDNVRQSIVPIMKTELVIGRGSRSKPVDIALTGDPEVSRRHAQLICDEAGNYTLLNEGKNPAIVNNFELSVGQRVRILPGQYFFICSYALRIQA